jgi:uncharacterized lipoprotein YmbA
MKRTHPQAFGRGWSWFALAAGLSLAGGCISVPIPPAEKDPTRYYVLGGGGAPMVALAADAPAVHLRPVEVASYLRAKPVVVRRGDHEIEFREFARWGESLDLGVGRVLREELAARGVRAGAAASGRALTVRVLACEGAADGAVIFRAVWELTRNGAADDEKAGQAAPIGGDFRATGLRWDGKAEASLAAQLSAAVTALAQEIADAAKRP